MSDQTDRHRLGGVRMILDRCPTCGRFVARAGESSVYCRRCLEEMKKDCERR